MDRRLEAQIPEGLDQFVNKLLLTGDADVRWKTTQFIEHRFTTEEVRQMIAEKKYSANDRVLIVSYYPELVDLHGELIQEFVLHRERIAQLLAGLEGKGQI